MSSASPVSRLIALLALAVFSGALVTRLTDPLVAVLARDLGADTARAALLASAFALPFALVQPILGPIGDALGKRLVMTVAIGLLTILLIACSTAPDLNTLMVLRALTGLAAGGLTPLALALVADSTTAEGRQVALSRLVAFAISGQIAGTPRPRHRRHGRSGPGGRCVRRWRPDLRRTRQTCPEVDRTGPDGAVGRRTVSDGLCRFRLRARVAGLHRLRPRTGDGHVHDP